MKFRNYDFSENLKIVHQKYDFNINFKIIF